MSQLEWPLGSEKLKQDVRTKELISTVDNCHNSHPKQQTMTTIMKSILKIWKDNQYSFFSLIVLLLKLIWISCFLLDVQRLKWNENFVYQC